MTEVIIPIETKKFYISCKHSDQIPKVTMIDNKISMSSDTKDDIKDDITDKKKKKYVYDKTIVHDYNQTYFNKPFFSLQVSEEKNMPARMLFLLVNGQWQWHSGRTLA